MTATWSRMEANANADIFSLYELPGN